MVNSKSVPTGNPWQHARGLGKAIALAGALVWVGCSAPVPDPVSDPAPHSSADVEPSSATSTAPVASPVPLRADDIRSFLAQGTVEASTQCPSTSVSNEAGRSLQKVAYFETTHYWIEICTHDNGDLEYYGRKRDNPELDLSLTAYAASDRPNTFIAQNGNTRYEVNAEALVVTQNGVPIIHEPVLRSSLNE